VASPLILQPDAAAGNDTFLISNPATTNSGSGINLVCGDASNTASSAVRSLIAPPSLPPAGVVITSVALDLWEYQTSATGAVTSWAVELRRVLRSWVEAETTWNIFSTGNNWGTAGCGNATDRDATVLATTTLDGTAANGFITWSGAGLVALMQAWTDDPASNLGVLLSAPTAENQGTAYAYNFFYSSDYATDAAKRPRWTIEYVVLGTVPRRSIGSGIGSGIASGIA